MLNLDSTKIGKCKLEGSTQKYKYSNRDPEAHNVFGMDC